MRVLKIDQVKKCVWKSDQLLFLYIAVDRFSDARFHLIDFWNTPFNLMVFSLEGSKSKRHQACDDTFVLCKCHVPVFAIIPLGDQV